MLQGNTVPMFQYEPCDTASQRWVVWADRFQWNKKSPRQRAFLLHMIGEELYSIFKTWKEGEPDVSKIENVYDTAKKDYIPARRYPIRCYPDRCVQIGVLIKDVVH